MPVNSSRAAKKPPPSEMIRVPTVLIPVVRQLATIHRQGHTIALLQGLEELIAQFDSSMEVEATTELQHVESKLAQIETQLSQQNEGVERKLEAIAKHLEKLERAVASGRYNGSGQTRNRRSAYPYQMPSVELQAFANENLARRLGVTPQSLIAEREKKSEKEFLSWSRNRDPMSVGWKWNSESGLYQPIK
ncbi:hypothetical protein A0J48_008905 [Sphaerospermopsis aphanizomenoides BCCUSP55]|uniref:hypothetical protein n=1 Tax=Sphaerospermopsis aphanizomenoides TaxID=459663 RepID=UPI000A8FE4E3|nr:hypothetical protein [Sphaerospermopsis aphanizomenoides]MBK1987653.1 hypothetical protein [Sphaerospermopsis aphanizomenoides BCCUSP55]